MAPEIYDYDKCIQGYSPEQSDIYSLGIILFVMYIGRPPYTTPNLLSDPLFELLVNG